MSYIKETQTRDEFLQRAKDRSRDSFSVRNGMLVNFDRFALDKYGKKTIDEILHDLKKEYDKNRNVTKALKVLQEYVDFLNKDHPNIKVDVNGKGKTFKPLMKKSVGTITQYRSMARLYIRFVGGIKIDNDDVSQFVVLPIDESDEEAEPLTKEEFRLILDHAATPKRKTMYMVKKDTGQRIGAMVRLRKKHFDMTKDPPVVTFPKSITKRTRGIMPKTAKRFLSKETMPGVNALLKNLNDDDLVFGTSENWYNARQNEIISWNSRIKKLGLDEKYQSNGRLKKNIHSIKAFCTTQCKEATKDIDYANAYTDHKGYLPQYIRLTDKEKIQKFRQCEPFLALYETNIIVDGTEELKGIKEKLEKFEMLDKLLQSIEQPKLEKLVESIKKQT